MENSFEGKAWWVFLGKDLQELLEEALLLTEKVSKWEEKFQDYSFIVFPAAKAYEGYLKQLFLDRNFISEKEYYGKRFRVGKALNPSLEKNLRARESVYDKLVKHCGNKDLPDHMWKTWKECRNLLFHWFPNEKNAITFEQAKERISMVTGTIEMSFAGCMAGTTQE